MKHLLRTLAFVALVAFVARAQEPLPPISPAEGTNLIVQPIYTLNVAPVKGANKQVVGVAGQKTYYYWAVANYPIGSVVSPLGVIRIAPNTLSGSNYVQISPFGYPAGVTSVDFLRTTTDLAPTGACNCAVATGVTSGVVNDQSNSLSSYTVPVFNPNAYAVTLTNEVVGPNSAHYILRQGWPYPGLQIADLSAGGAGGITGATANGGLVATGPTLGLFTNCGTGQVEAWNGTSWACANATYTVQNNGTSLTQRSKLNVSSYLNGLTNCFDNSGAAATDCIFGEALESDAFLWSQSPSGTLTGGTPATVTLNPCPQGIDPSFLIANSDTITGDYWVYISGTGTAEAVYVTATTCTSASWTGSNSGTITFTPANSHSAGWTVGTATSGIQEAINWGQQIISTARGVTVLTPDTSAFNGFAIDGAPIYAPIMTHGNFTSIVSRGGTRLSQQFLGAGIVMGDWDAGANNYFYTTLRNITFAPTYPGTAPQINLVQSVTESGTAPCIYTITYTANHDLKAGEWVVNSGNLNYNYVAGVYQVASVPAANQITIQTNSCPVLTGSVYAGGNTVALYAPIIDNLNSSGVLENVAVITASGGQRYHHGIILTSDESLSVSHFSDSPNAFRTSTAEWNSALIYCPGPSTGIHANGAGILYITNNTNLEGSSLGPAGIDCQSGNDVRISDTTIQNFYPFGVRVSRRRGGFGNLTITGSHFEAGCYTGFVNAGCAGIVTDGYPTFVDSATETDAGGTANFGSFGAGNSLQVYFVIPVSSTSDTLCSTQPNDQRCISGTNLGTGPVLPVGYANFDAGTGGTPIVNWWAIPGATSYILLRAAESSTAPGFTPNGTGNYLIASAINPLTACTDQYCSFTDSNITPTSYSVPVYGETSYSAYAPMWGAAVFLGSSFDFNTGGVLVPYEGPCSWNNASVVSENTPGSNLVRCNTGMFVYPVSGAAQGLFFQGNQVSSVNCCLGGNVLWQPLKNTMTNGTDSGGITNVKGKINFGVQLTTLGTPVDAITLWDCNFQKTLNMVGGRPSNDACDTFIGADSFSASGNPASGTGVGLAFGANLSISNYIGHVEDNSSYLERLTSTLKTFTVPVKFGSTTVGALPSAASNTFATIGVTDSTTISAEGQTCVGGSSTKAIAISNGSVWRCF